MRTDGVGALGFHEGELATQRRAGVLADAKRIERMLDVTGLSTGAAKFLAAQTFVAMTGRDGDGVLWVSPLTGPAGFARAAGHTLQISALPRAGDALRAMPAGQQVGMVAINFATRRRLRVNGTLVAADTAGLTVRVDQAYGNCPQYIRRRTVNVPAIAAPASANARRAIALTPADAAMIEAADTFFLGTAHPARGSDASHRGGPAGFVRVESPDRLSWPDYPGNKMFNSFGNLAVDDGAAVLFVDFDSGATLQLSGAAEVQWTTPGDDGDDGGVGRSVAFSVRSVFAGGGSRPAVA